MTALENLALPHGDSYRVSRRLSGEFQAGPLHLHFHGFDTDAASAGDVHLGQSVRQPSQVRQFRRRQVIAATARLYHALHDATGRHKGQQ